MPETILVVDDHPPNRAVLRRLLEREGYDVIEAVDGREALETIAEEDLDLILLDVMMPEVDGLQVLARLRATTPPEVLPVIMATARDESSQIVEALAAGANDYVTKPLDMPVVLARVRTQLALRGAMAALDRANARMRDDLAAAVRIQQAGLPGVVPERGGIRVAWSVRPCDELAGDTLGVLDFASDLRGVYLADVSGHGVPAALLAVTLGHVLSALPGNEVVHDGQGRPRPPGDVVASLNERFQIDLSTMQYFTLCYGLIDPGAGTFTFSCAGHPGPVVLARDEPPLVAGAADIPVGWSEDATFQVHVCSFGQGTRMFMHSDGLIEATNASEEQFGTDRLLAAAAMHRDEPLQAWIDHIIEAVVDWRAGPLADDLAVLAIEHV